jgi:AFG3 family protein
LQRVLGITPTLKRHTQKHGGFKSNGTKHKTTIRVTTGASDDLRRVTQLVYSTIQVYGMNSRVGQLAFPKDPNAMPGEKPYSDATAEAMDEEARATVDAAYQRTLNLLQEKRDHVGKVASLLLEKETITHDDIVDLLGPQPFTPDAQYQDFVSNRPRQKSSELEEAMPGPDNPDFTPGLA